MTKNFEKLVFLEMTNKEMSLLPNPDYIDIYKELSQNEKEHFGNISRQIHNIWTEINTNEIPNVKTKLADSIEEYDTAIEKVDPAILKCNADFGITLKGQINPKFKEALIKFLGKEFWQMHFEK